MSDLFDMYDERIKIVEWLIDIPGYKKSTLKTAAVEAVEALTLFFKCSLKKRGVVFGSFDNIEKLYIEWVRSGYRFDDSKFYKLKSMLFDWVDSYRSSNDFNVSRNDILGVITLIRDMEKAEVVGIIENKAKCQDVSMADAISSIGGSNNLCKGKENIEDTNPLLDEGLQELLKVADSIY